MATGPRGGGAIGPNRASPPVYEDFRPVSEWHQEAGAEILLISLPGFMKESIRVSIEGKNTVRVGGEIFIGSNTWCRFQEDFQAPDDCNIKRIDVKFEDGILTITVPRKRPRQLLDEQTERFPHRIPHEDDNIPPTNNHSTDETPRKLPSLQPTTQHAHKDQDSTRNETSRSAESSNTQKGDNVPSRTTYPTNEAAPRKPTPVKPTAQLPKPQHAHNDQDSSRNETSRSAESSNTQKGDNVPSRTTYATTEAAPRKPTPVKPTAQLPKPQHAHKDQDSGVKENKSFDNQLINVELSKTQKSDEDIDYPALRTTPLDKTSGEREKTKDEKKFLEGLVESIESNNQKINEENLDHNIRQFTENGKQVEMKESHNAGGKIISEKSEELREEFQEKVEQKRSNEKESTKKGWADCFWKCFSWFT